MSAELFVKASRNRYRFDTSKGSLSTEDLWALSLTDLDRMAVALDNSIGRESKSFLDNPKVSPVISEVGDKVEILKFIISVKQAENKAKLQAREIEQKKALIKEILEKKRNDDLSQLSADELSKLLNELG